MQNSQRTSSARQIALGEILPVRDAFVPAVRPTADGDLEESFVRAAAAWARWRERRLWEGR
jgi:hypothetical protein